MYVVTGKRVESQNVRIAESLNSVLKIFACEQSQ